MVQSEKKKKVYKKYNSDGKRHYYCEYTSKQFEKFKYEANLPDCVLYLYKTLKVELQCAIVQLDLLKDMKKYLSVLVDISKKIQLDYQIEKQIAYIELLEKKMKLVYYKIDEICYSKLYDKDKAVFKEIIINDLPPKEAKEGNLKMYKMTYKEILQRANRMLVVLSKCKVK